MEKDKMDDIPYPFNLMTELANQDDEDIDYWNTIEFLKAVDGLPEKSRLVIEMFYKDRKPATEIAQAMQLSTQRIYAIKSKACRVLLVRKRYYKMVLYRDAREREKELEHQIAILQAELYAALEEIEKIKESKIVVLKSKDDIKKYNPVIKISDMGFSTMVTNSLLRGGYKTLNDLANTSIEKLDKLRCFGPKSRGEVVTKLYNDYGIDLPLKKEGDIYGKEETHNSRV